MQEEKDRKISINPRNLDNEKSSILIVDDSIVDEAKERFNLLKIKLKDNIKEDISNKIETMYILQEIKEKEYYKLDGYKSFTDFSKVYSLAKSQAYNYLKIASAIQDGILEERFLLENGFNQTLNFIKIKESEKFKKSGKTPLKPLRFQLKSQEAYDFYKRSSKFTSFILEDMFQNDKKFLEDKLLKYKNTKI
ncbi:chromosome replication/partitioning protein (plasmid) [Borrelia coriaceae]|nr:chromosome replication/partitioning protein [Borrelia coriaceae]UPA17420.1 chromosome replication/partitioning protein [Borrelia coriaceae]